MDKLPDSTQDQLTNQCSVNSLQNSLASWIFQPNGMLTCSHWMGGELKGQLVSLTSSCLGSTSSIPLELSRGNKRGFCRAGSPRKARPCSLEFTYKLERLTLPLALCIFLLDCIAYELSVASVFQAPRACPHLVIFTEGRMKKLW